MALTIRELQHVAYVNSEQHGFWDDCPDAGRKPGLYRAYLGNKLMLIAGEVAEAHEELRKPNIEPGDAYESYKPVPPSFAVDFSSGQAALDAWKQTQVPKPEGLPSELADIMIRVADLATHLGIDLAEAIEEKVNYNASREHLHGKAF